jgi:bifunctional non-homologous end joining protein LigD
LLPWERHLGRPSGIKPQLTRLVEEAPTGNGWLHEIKYDGYRRQASNRGVRSQGHPS